MVESYHHFLRFAVLDEKGKEKLSNLAKDLIGDRFQWEVAEEK